MSTRPILRAVWAALATAVLLPQLASAHYIWIAVERPETAGDATIRAFFNEPPEPDPAFTKYLKDLRIVVDGQTVPSTLGEESRDARWSGQLPAMVDTERELGVMTKGEKTFRLFYTARAQTRAVAADSKEEADKLRVRLIEVGEEAKIEVLFNGKAVAKARIRVYPPEGDPTETEADGQGRATIAGLAEGKTALWANWIDPQTGETDGKPYAETRYYATFTYAPAPKAAQAAGTPGTAAPSTAFATMPEPAVNSFGGAVLGDWLYVYSGHIGRTHRYSVETTAKHFRRLNLTDRRTWEDLPMANDLQGVALVSDGKALYRIGGMAARNAVGADHDLHSVADFARFDPESKTWTDLAPMPVPRSTHDAVIIGRTVYSVGGWTMNGESEGSDFCEDMVAFDLDHPEAGWQTIAQPFHRRALSAAAVGGKLYVLGGLTDEGKVVRGVDVYDPSTKTWSTGPDLPGSSRVDGFGTSSFGIDGRLYFSGSAGRIFRLDAAGKAWEAIGAWALPRITHRILPGPGQTLLAVGGNAKGQQIPIIESIQLPKSIREDVTQSD